MYLTFILIGGNGIRLLLRTFKCAFSHTNNSQSQSQSQSMLAFEIGLVEQQIGKLSANSLKSTTNSGKTIVIVNKQLKVAWITLSILCAVWWHTITKYSSSRYLRCFAHSPAQHIAPYWGRRILMSHWQMTLCGSLVYSFMYVYLLLISLHYFTMNY